MSWLSRLSRPRLFGALFAVIAVVLGLIVATVVSTRNASASEPLYLAPVVGQVIGPCPPGSVLAGTPPCSVPLQAVPCPPGHTPAAGTTCIYQPNPTVPGPPDALRPCSTTTGMCTLPNGDVIPHNVLVPPPAPGPLELPPGSIGPIVPDPPRSAVEAPPVEAPPVEQAPPVEAPPVEQAPPVEAPPAEQEYYEQPQQEQEQEYE